MRYYFGFICYDSVDVSKESCRESLSFLCKNNLKIFVMCFVGDLVVVLFVFFSLTSWLIFPILHGEHICCNKFILLIGIHYT